MYCRWYILQLEFLENSPGWELQLSSIGTVFMDVYTCTHYFADISFQNLKERAGNDRYTERGMQTINFSAKAKQIQTEPIKKTVNKNNRLLHIEVFVLMLLCVL